MDEHYLFTGPDPQQALESLAPLMPEGTHALAQYAAIPDEYSATDADTLVLVSGDQQAFKALITGRSDFLTIPASTADEEEDSDEAWEARERRRLFGVKNPSRMVHLAPASFDHGTPTQGTARTGFSAERRFHVPPGHYLLSYLPGSVWFEVNDILVSVSEGRPLESRTGRRYTVHAWGPRTPGTHAPSAYLTGAWPAGRDPNLPDWAADLVNMAASDVDRIIEHTAPTRQNEGRTPGMAQR